MIATVEYIHHYTCDECKGWWSIASHENYKPKRLYCPMCGTLHEDIEFAAMPGAK